ncbi:metacaspase-1-like [Prunus yedoensis var. nudiflora]|uniref:Metacaspase-1-like n=1 Tax=Prunus yedoensis var. nudiflora TaxID=2094558 RepID=A0A314Y620_PRUYE|nr:metacaspase-1-like [Prunus yedoensis var. nudiflora]
MPPSSYGRKRALLCGVSYHGRSYNLNGTVNDVNCMKYFLVNRRGFPADSILMLTEYEADPYRIPTKQNIRMALQWLVRVADQETHWCFTSPAMAQPSLTTTWMRLMALTKRCALWILRPRDDP